MTPRWISLPLLALVVACDEKPPADTGAFLDCTEIGCSDSYDADFSPALTAQGDYVFTLDIDGEITTCIMALPLVETESCDAPLQITRSGSALPESEHSLPSFTILETGFESYTLTIELDGVELVSWTEEPEWELVQPNGEGCEPVCEVARSTVMVP